MPSPWHYESDVVRIRKFCVGGFENNVYIVACAVTGEAVVIDAAAEPDRIIAECADVEPTAILTTHGHWDHVQAAAAMRTGLGVPWRIHPEDVELAGLTPDVPLADGESVAVGNLLLEVIHTPGHTAGSCCFLLWSHLFSGDTLFPGGPGATGGPGEFTMVMASLQNRLFTLDDDTLVYPGHGLNTTIGTERPQLPVWAERGW